MQISIMETNGGEITVRRMHSWSCQESVRTKIHIPKSIPEKVSIEFEIPKLGLIDIPIPFF